MQGIASGNSGVYSSFIQHHHLPIPLPVMYGTRYGLAVFASTWVLCGMWYVLSHDVSPGRQGITPQLSCRRSPRFALTSKGPLNYMTEPPRFFSFQVTFTFTLWMFSPWNGFETFQMVQPFTKYQCMSSLVWHTTALGSLLLLHFQDWCTSSWVGHTPFIQVIRGSCHHSLTKPYHCL